ncbi:SseB family protein [Nocardioides mesophilus]|uniref:SseB family protein n=1 Tax=Nocardioides mesophilus TaxID=433659 RepID=A0A7G9RAG6_9ACTN|nr:SseB family protein [Nocardioides mesophilus]QNN52591.1 SseB family protein [Nocardioides mesophilus]
MRSIPDPGFPGDSGAAAPEVSAALAAYAADPEGGYTAMLQVLQHARLLVPVVAVLGEAEVDEQGLTRDKTSDMATVLMRGRDGRTALLAFTGTDTLHRWDPQARPVPVTVTTAAEAAVQDGAEALLVDVAGPVRVVVGSADLRELARGNLLLEVSGRPAWVTPDR